VTADEATRIVRSHRLLRRYVLPDERVLLAARRHWAKLSEPVLTTVAVLVGCGWLTAELEPTLGERALVVWWLAAAAAVRLAWSLLLWRVEWFVATDKRMLLLTGLVTHQVGMMPLLKVTDMRYSRSVLGQLLGYGQFLLESAGQDQALRQIDWVARPDETYRDLCALIFTPNGPGTRPVPEPAPEPTPHASPTRSWIAPHRSSDEGREAAHRPAPGDTQPIRTRASAHEVPAGPDGSDGSDGTDGADDAAWFVSEPTARYVDLTSPDDPR